jgi:HEPN domain-containing protein
VKWHEQTITLIRKADQDLYLMRSHQADLQVSDEMWGFHAQQAVEKLIKALLSHKQIRYPFSHRLRELAELAAQAGTSLPPHFDPLMDLTPYAAELRYAMLPQQETEVPLDRAHLLTLTEMLREHVHEVTA